MNIDTKTSLPRRRRAWAGLLIIATIAVALLSAPLTPASAVVTPETPAIDPATGPDTEISLVRTGSGSTIQGFEPTDPTTIQDPTTPYPAADPTSGYQPLSNFAGTIITASISNPALTAEMYCINLRVPTYGGIGYESGTWDESAVPNIGYVTHILNAYYPTTGEPAGLSVNQRAAAVQAAIWYFTDGYVVSSTSSAIRTAAASIVAAAQANGPVAEPPAPDVTITPLASSAPVGEVAGPFVVDAENAAQVTVSVPAGAEMFADETATTPLANPSVVAAGTAVWVRSVGTAASETVLRARAVVTVQRGEVYLYDGYTPGLEDAQRLILANTTELDGTAQATASFFAVGALTVGKVFTGEAAGDQGAGQLAIDCGDGYTFVQEVPAGATAETTFTFPGIPVGRTCVVTEPVTGASTTVDVTSDVPQQAVVTAEGAALTVTNTVSYRPGSLSVVKQIAGAAAGRQGEIVVEVDCGEALAETSRSRPRRRPAAPCRPSPIFRPGPSAPSRRRRTAAPHRSWSLPPTRSPWRSRPAEWPRRSSSTPSLRARRRPRRPRPRQRRWFRVVAEPRARGDSRSRAVPRTEPSSASLRS